MSGDPSSVSHPLPSSVPHYLETEGSSGTTTTTVTTSPTRPVRNPGVHRTSTVHFIVTVQPTRVGVRRSSSQVHGYHHLTTPIRVLEALPYESTIPHTSSRPVRTGVRGPPRMFVTRHHSSLTHWGSRNRLTSSLPSSPSAPQSLGCESRSRDTDRTTPPDPRHPNDSHRR